MLIYPEANLLDIAGPLQVFASASHHAMASGVSIGPAYKVEIVSLEDGGIPTSAQISLTAPRAEPGVADTFLVAGGTGAIAAAGRTDLLDWVRHQASLSRRTGSVCTGAFVLAAAGLLDGRSATTHWDYCEHMTRSYPGVIVHRGIVFVRDDDIWTSAGVLAGVDMALAMVEADLGARLTGLLARQLVVTRRRPSDTPQISTALTAQDSEMRRLRRLLDWMLDNPDADLSLPALADRAHMSIRNLQRRFRLDVGKAPSRFVETLRLENARRLLQTTDMSLDRVAQRSGFANAGAMRRVFRRCLDRTPSSFRRSDPSR